MTAASVPLQSCIAVALYENQVWTIFLMAPQKPRAHLVASGWSLINTVRLALAATCGMLATALDQQLAHRAWCVQQLIVMTVRLALAYLLLWLFGVVVGAYLATSGDHPRRFLQHRYSPTLNFRETRRMIGPTYVSCLLLLNPVVSLQCDPPTLMSRSL